jgi:hypothetical protein
MKTTSLLLALAVTSLSAHAQLSLTGTSYSQNFNSITASLPTGWYAYNSATPSSLGVIETWNGSVNYGVYADTVYMAGDCKPDVYGGGSKNYASANNGNASKVATCAEQKTFTDRAIGFRQVSQTNGSHPNLEPGAAYVLKIANTSYRTNFNLTFKLQSLDTTSPRTTTWTVDYATGATPTSFTAAPAVGTMTTGNLTFSNNTITVNFGSALDNSSAPVWIRIAALTASSGSGNRASTAIDDYNLTWTGNGVGVEDVNAQSAASLMVLGNATSDKVSFGYNVNEPGQYNLAIYDITGRPVYNSTVATGAAGQHTVNGLSLASGFYVARMSNGNSVAVTKFAVK